LDALKNDPSISTCYSWPPRDRVPLPVCRALLVLALAFATLFHQPSSTGFPPYKSSHHSTPNPTIPARIGEKRRLPAASREQKKSGKSKEDQSIWGRELRDWAPSMESPISRTDLNCISLADPDIQKSVELLKQVRDSFLIVAILVSRCLDWRKLGALRSRLNLWYNGWLPDSLLFVRQG
jgi:hypothetical protein